MLLLVFLVRVLDVIDFQVECATDMISSSQDPARPTSS